MKSEPESRFQNGIDLKVQISLRLFSFFLSLNCKTSRTSFALQFGIEDLKAQPEQTACWDGVRNYQVKMIARELRDKGNLWNAKASSHPDET